MIHKPYIFKNKIVAQNRVQLAAMTNQQSHAEGSLSKEEAHFLQLRAQGGFGMITTCAAYVSKQGKAWAGQIGLDSDVFESELSKLALQVKQSQALLIGQLFHGGLRASSVVSGLEKISASNYYKDSILDARAMLEAEIESVIEDFVQAALRLERCGFAGVELHGAHGYLIHQFLSKDTNRRTDAWGGNAENRERFLMQIFSRIKKQVSHNFLVGIRLSPEDKLFFKGIDFDESIALAQKLEAEGADFIHISLWDAFKKPEKYPNSKDLAITHFRKALGNDTCLITAGGIWTPQQAETLLNAGVDIVALGRVALPHPDWPKRAQDPLWQPLNPPFSPEYLQNQGLAPVFVNYMRRWEGFVG